MMLAVLCQNTGLMRVILAAEKEAEKSDNSVLGTIVIIGLAVFLFFKWKKNRPINHSKNNGASSSGQTSYRTQQVNTPVQTQQSVLNQPVSAKKFLIGLAVVIGVFLVIISVADKKQMKNNDSQTNGATKTTTSDKLNLREQLCTNELLEYYFENGDVGRSTVSSFEILSSRTTDDHDSSTVQIVLSDSFIERTLFLSVESTKYNQGWMIDSSKITDSSLKLVGDVDQNFIYSKLSQDQDATWGSGNFTNYRSLKGVDVGFKNISLTSSSISGNTYYADYSVNDSYQYVDISGTLSITVNVTMYFESKCYVYRDLNINTDAIISSWHDIFGTYKLSHPANGSTHDQFVTVDANKTVYGYEEYKGAWDDNHYHEDFVGNFDEVGYSTAITYVHNGWGYDIYIIFTPTSIDYRYLRPNGSDYDDGEPYNKVTFEKV